METLTHGGKIWWNMSKKIAIKFAKISGILCFPWKTARKLRPSFYGKQMPAILKLKTIPFLLISPTLPPTSISLSPSVFLPMFLTFLIVSLCFACSCFSFLSINFHLACEKRGEEGTRPRGPHRISPGSLFLLHCWWRKKAWRQLCRSYLRTSVFCVLKISHDRSKCEP